MCLYLVIVVVVLFFHGKIHAVLYTVMHSLLDTFQFYKIAQTKFVVIVVCGGYIEVEIALKQNFSVTMTQTDHRKQCD